LSHLAARDYFFGYIVYPKWLAAGTRDFDSSAPQLHFPNAQRDWRKKPHRSSQPRKGEWKAQADEIA
jgi:hypothetical protein